MRQVRWWVVTTAISITTFGLSADMAWSAGPGGAPPAAPPTLLGVDQALAEAMADQCLVQHHAVGWPAFSFVVVDAAGAPVLLRRQDGAAPVTADAALLKARTAARFGAPTQALVAMEQDAPSRDIMLLLQLTANPGGIPLKVGGRIIGAVGVSGGSADQDVGCASIAANVLSAEKK